jgi:hypothetical protein
MIHLIQNRQAIQEAGKSSSFRGGIVVHKKPNNRKHGAISTDAQLKMIGKS